MANSETRAALFLRLLSRALSHFAFILFGAPFSLCCELVRLTICGCAEDSAIGVLATLRIVARDRASGRSTSSVARLRFVCVRILFSFFVQSSYPSNLSYRASIPATLCKFRSCKSHSTREPKNIKRRIKVRRDLNDIIHVLYRPTVVTHVIEVISRRILCPFLYKNQIPQLTRNDSMNIEYFSSLMFLCMFTAGRDEVQ